MPVVDVGRDEDPVATERVEVEFQIPVPLEGDGTDAEAEAMDEDDRLEVEEAWVEEAEVEAAAEDELEVEEIWVEEAVEEAAAEDDEDNVGLDTVDVVGGFAQSQSVNCPLRTSTYGFPSIRFCSE